MHYSSLLAAGALAAQANSFLIIPGTTPPSAGNPDLAASLQDAKTTAVEARCHNCNFHPNKPAGSFETVVLNFVVDSENHIRLNNQPFYPIEEGGPIGFKATVRAPGQPDTEPLTLGFALEKLPADRVSDEGAEIVPLPFTVVDIDGKTAQVDTIKVSALKRATGEVMIAKIQKICFTMNTPGANCQTSLCRLRALAAARVHQFLEAARSGAAKLSGKLGLDFCHRRKGSNANATPRPFHHKGPFVHGSHKHHAHHHGHRLAHFLHQALRLFIVPALLGIVGGLTACLVGTIIGQILGFMWIRFVRGGRRQPIAIIVEEAGTVNEKEALIIDEEFPPRYEDAEEQVPVPEKQ